MAKWREPIIHSFAWIMVLLFFMFTSGKGELTYRSIVIVGYFGIINIAIFYVNYLYAIPQYLSLRKYLRYAFAILLILLISAAAKIILRYTFSNLLFAESTEMGKMDVGIVLYFGSTLFVGSFFIFISTAAKFMADWFNNQKIQTELQNQKLSAELAFLKSQINPHFLFNSLNNIYSLAYQKSAKTPEAILKLSEILRYMLYESNDDRVELAKEINYLGSYIELQKLRFKDNAFINYSIEGNAANYTVLPLVLISFVENAFKHGITDDEHNPIIINLKINQKKLYFQVINKKSRLNKDDTGGIGLMNVKRRLDLLYKGKYHIGIEDGPSLYHSELFLDIE